MSLGQILAAVALALFAASPALAQRAVDGDTLRIGAESIRLFGIDAPEKAQPCDDGRWHSGPIATRELPGDYRAARSAVPALLK